MCSPPFSPPKSTVLIAQRSVEAPGLSLSLSKNHTPEMEGVITVSILPHTPLLLALLCNLDFVHDNRNLKSLEVCCWCVAERHGRENATRGGTAVTRDRAFGEGGVQTEGTQVRTSSPQVQIIVLEQ